MTHSPAPGPTPVPSPERVGDYRLLARLGEGGMGVVHLAQRGDGRRVALKVLRPHVVGDEEARERLAREVSSLRRISSPRIAEILDADPHGPTPYVVTRYVPGLSLYHHVAEEGPVAGRDLLHFADCLAEALQAVHRVGVLHRDVKPTNVLMEGRSPVLIDFGLARVAEDPRLTQTGWLLGTPGYLAPEILYGDDATAAADVHAWAATTVYAATGRPPYGTGPAMAIMDRVRRGQFDLAGIEGPLRGLLADAMAPEPLDRPSVPELRTWLTDEREAHHLSAVPRAPVEPEPWTMPFAPVPDPDAPPRTEVRPLPTDLPAEVPDTPVTPAAPATPATPPQRPVMPYQQPAPPTRVLPPAAPAPTSQGQRVLQLLGLGALTTSAVAYAPYLGTALVGLVVLLLRTASVGKQRHARRRMVRGGARWYDVPTTTLSTPGYVVLALFGAVADIVLALLCALGMFAIGYLAGQPPRISLVLAGLGFTPALWWGPGSSRLREMVRGLVARNARSEFGGWFLVVMCALGSAVLLGLLLSGGPNWAPRISAPWQ